MRHASQQYLDACGLSVEVFAKRHDVQASLPQRRADGRSRFGLTSFDDKLYVGRHHLWFGHGGAHVFRWKTVESMLPTVEDLQQDHQLEDLSRKRYPDNLAVRLRWENVAAIPG